jgi:hypothetical protein
VSTDPDRLHDLRRHWGDVYSITHNGPKWVAVWRAEGGLLSAGSAAELRQMIRNDYYWRTVKAAPPGGRGGAA